MPNNEIVINDTLKIKNAKTPTLADVLFSFTLANGIPVKGSQGYYTIQALIDALGADAKASMKLAERYAKGTEDGEPVSSGEGYQDNSKYYKELAGQKASEASQSAAEASASEINAKASENAAEESETHAKASENAAKASEDAAKESEENAAESESNSFFSANNAAASALISERYAKGTEDGQPVSSGEGYQDNSKYYKELADQKASEASQSASAAALSAQAALASEKACEELVKSVDAEGLSARMDTIEDAQSALTQDISEEQTARQNADNSLQTQINGKLPITGNAVSASKLQTARSISLSGDASGSVNFDGSANVSLPVTVKDDSHNHVIANIDGLQDSLNGKLGITEIQANSYRRMPAGTVLWFAGKTAKIPAGTLICNGAAVSRTTYADLFNAIGTTYGAGDGSSTFNIPNLMDGGDDGNLGRFIRAATKDSEVGVKQIDTIRNITGATPTTWGSTATHGFTGPFKLLPNSTLGLIPHGAAIHAYRLYFDASLQVNTDEENRPSNILMIPVITY